MNIKFLFAWYDIWIGVYYDRKKRQIYIFPLPMIGFVITLMSKEERTMCRIIKDVHKLRLQKNLVEMKQYFEAIIDERSRGL